MGYNGPPKPVSPLTSRPDSATTNTPAEQQQVTDGQIASGQTDSTAAGSANVNGTDLTSGPTGSGGSDPYNLGVAVAGAPIDLQGLPTSVLQEVLKVSQGLHQPIKTAQDLMTVMTHMSDPTAITYIQHALFYAHQYPPTSTISDISSGVMDEGTVAGLKKMVTTTAQSGAAFGDYLTKAANFGKATNDINQAAGVGQPLTQINHLDALGMDAVLRKEAQAMLGHDPTASDFAAFRNLYDNLYSQAEKNVNLAQAKAQQKADVASGVFGTPQDLASAYNALDQPAPPEPDGSTPSGGPLSARDSELSAASPPHTVLSARDTELSAAQDKTDAYNQWAGQLPGAQDYANAVAANQNPGARTFDTTLAPPAGDAADQFLQDRYGAEIAKNNNLGTYGQVLSWLKGTA